MDRKTYTFDEAFKASLEYFTGDELAAKVWVNKYALKDGFGNIYEKSPVDMHHRLAKEIARIEKQYPNPLSEEELFNLFDHFRYIIPQGSPMTGIGNDYQIASLSNCFVIGLDGAADSYGAIIRIDEEQVQLMKRRGGVGHDLSHIRPKGSPVKNSALTSTGLVPFMERYSNSTREVAQDGRRGALMLSVSIKHPDSESFIDAKMTEGKVTGANVSVKIDDEFMQAVVNHTPYQQQYPIDSSNPMVAKEIDAASLWRKIIHNAWKSAEPGVLFWDTIIRESVPDSYADLGFRTVSTNPCGEIPLCPYDSCRLLAINLYSYVVNPFTQEAYFDFDLFRKHVILAQRIMDDIIDLESEKIEKILDKVDSDPESMEVKQSERHLWEKIQKKTLLGRRTGVGITAEGDMLAALGLRYGTEEATDFAEKVQKTLALAAYRSSVEMAKDAGCEYIIIGHSERRQYFGETDEMVNKKAKKILSEGLVPIICCGESLEQREAGVTDSHIASQIKAALNGLTADEVAKSIIAYEPIWAIGTGKTCDSVEANRVIAMIRNVVKEVAGAQAADAIRILYGGSVKPETIEEQMAQSDIDGALVGGASLKADSFAKIVRGALK